MYKGDIDNKFAPVIVLDANIIYTPKRDTLIERAKSLLKHTQFKLTHTSIPKYLDKLFYADFSLYILDRNKTLVRQEKLFEGFSYTQYFHTTDEEEIMSILGMTKVKYAFFDRDYPCVALHSPKTEYFVNWETLMERVR